MDYMHETLLIILGFLFGVSGQVIVSLNMEKRKKRATQDLIRSEMQSLMESCENAGKMRFWDSTTVEHLCRHIIESYTNDRDRFMAFSSHSPRQQVFRFYFTPLTGVLFTFPSRYLFTIGHQGVFSLGRWSSQFPTGFHVSRSTREICPKSLMHFVYRTVTFYGQPFQVVRLYMSFVTLRQFRETVRQIPTTPRIQRSRAITYAWFGLFPVRSPLLGESLLFSFPEGT